MYVSHHSQNVQYCIFNVNRYNIIIFIIFHLQLTLYVCTITAMKCIYFFNNIYDFRRTSNKTGGGGGGVLCDKHYVQSGVYVQYKDIRVNVWSCAGVGG